MQELNKNKPDARHAPRAAASQAPLLTGDARLELLRNSKALSLKCVSIERAGQLVINLQAPLVAARAAARHARRALVRVKHETMHLQTVRIADMRHAGFTLTRALRARRARPPEARSVRKHLVR